jgi:uncharacterized protein (TIGR02246 family)
MPHTPQARCHERMTRTRTAPVAAVMAWTGALNRHDPDGVAAAFAADGVMTDTATGQRAEGRVEIREAAAGFIECSPTCGSRRPRSSVTASATARSG